MQSVTLILLIAVVNERLVEYFFSWLTPNQKRVAAAVIGVALCVLFQADVFALLGFPALVPYAGAAVSGLLSAGGANYINDFLSRFMTGRAPAVVVNAASVKQNG